MKLVINTKQRKVSLASRDVTNPPSDDILKAMICQREKWPDEDCDVIEVPQEIESDLAEADNIEITAGGQLVYSENTPPPPLSAAAKAVKEKYPDVFTLLHEAGIVG